MDRKYGTVVTKNQASLAEYRTSIHHDARQRCPALIVLKEDNNNNMYHIFRLIVTLPVQHI